MENDKQQGLVAILTANIIFGLNTPVTKALMDSWMTPLGYTITRMVFGAIIFWLIGAFLKKEKVEKRDMITILLGGLMGFSGTQLLFAQALKYTTPVIFSLLMALAPVIVLILSVIILRERIPLLKLIGILISISGAALIILVSTSSQAGSNNTLGILFDMLCVLCYSGYMVLTRKVSMKYQPVTIAKWMFLVSAISVLPFGFPSLSEQTIYSDASTLSAFGLLMFALLFSTTIAFFLMPYALKRLEASTASIFMNLQPLVASLAAIAVGQDYFTWDKPVAAMLIIIGVLLVTRVKKPQPVRV